MASAAGRIALPLATDVERNDAAVGELDGVGEQVEQHLFDARRVQPHALWHVLLDVDVQRQALAHGLRAHQRLDAVHQAAQVDLADQQRQAARFELGHVEDVVEDLQQVVGRLGGGAQVVELLRIEPGLAQQREHAEQALERRADLVAHVGQEGALGAVRGMRLAL